MPYRCRRCHRVLSDNENINRGYGPTCYYKQFGIKPKKYRFKYRTFIGYINKFDVPPLFEEEESEENMGTITVVNNSTLTDRFALSIVADYYNDKNNDDLIELINHLKISVIKKGHKFIIVDKNTGDEKLLVNSKSNCRNSSKTKA